MGLPSHSIHMHVSKADGSEERPLYHHPLQSVLPFCYSALVSALHIKNNNNYIYRMWPYSPKRAVTTAYATLKGCGHNRARNIQPLPQCVCFSFLDQDPRSASPPISMTQVHRCASKFGTKPRSEPPKWPPASKPQTSDRQGMMPPSQSARFQKEGGQYEGASQPARPGRVHMMRSVTCPPGSIAASMCHAAAPPHHGRNVLQFAGWPQSAPAVDWSQSYPNIQAARDDYPAFPDEGNDTDAAPAHGWVRHLDNELTGTTKEFYYDEKDRCELPFCAPRVLTGGGYNRRYSEGGVRVHVRACLVCMHNWTNALASGILGRSPAISQLCGKAAGCTIPCTTCWLTLLMR